MTDPTKSQNQDDAQTFEKALNELQYLQDAETILDLLLIVADKPTNYSGLATFIKNDLWRYARVFVQTRHPEVSGLDIDKCVGEIERVFSAHGVDILTFGGLKYEPELSDSMQYYTSEWAFQSMVYHLFESTINDTVDEILARPSLESAIFRTWVQKIIADANPESVLITVDIDEFKHYIRQTLEQEVEQLDAEMVKETLAKARAAYVVEGNTLHPFWFYSRKDFREELRRMAQKV